MAGYIMSLNNINSLTDFINKGVYSTTLKEAKIHKGSKNSYYWGVSQEGTLADYSSMKAGDNIYFFIKRKIYGIGVLKNIYNDCKFNNYPNADEPSIVKYKNIKI
ncbi:hypothetical protein [Clostridium fallax]|uniref:EVE domain-containing protein n=1 Tax=Clostridium fallax TaxID=1533 RepID=A0A1M4Z8D5_9CLOT|nr:hypothetical protein [Clostridium fallax]SHF14281.1 hypothetical protein SAMN05443638_13913 [Clostridium fallax]SQB07490.1 Uncharacterised protein [Clostridium fallax]